MKLLVILNNIKIKNKEGKRFLAASSGKQFENLLISSLTKNGDYILISNFEYKKSSNYKKIKKMILSMKGDEELIETKMHNSISQGRSIVIFQPHGSQSYPDILLLKDNKILPIECKFSAKSGNKPTWNSGLPRSGGLYIFGSYDKSDITFFKGEDYLTASERSVMNYAFGEASKVLQEKYKENLNWSLYLRKMFNQKFSSLDHPKRSVNEQNAIRVTKNFEDK